jgi:hypothetical protein
MPGPSRSLMRFSSGPEGRKRAARIWAPIGATTHAAREDLLWKEHEIVNFVDSSS